MQFPGTELELPEFTDMAAHRKRSLKLLRENQGSLFAKFLLQMNLLLRKNFLIQRRSLKTLFFQLLTPFIVCLIINEWQSIAENVFTGTEIESKVSPVPILPKCFYTREDPHNCTTIAYSIIGKPEPWIHSVMKYVAHLNDLKMDQDVKYLAINSSRDYSKYLMNNLNRTDLGVIFCTSEWQLFNITTLPCKFETPTDQKLVMYNLLYNVSEYLKPPVGDDFKVAHPKHPGATRLKISLDQAIISYFTIDQDAKGDREIDLISREATLPKITVETQDFPKTHFRFLIGSDVVSLFGCLQFAIPYMINFLSTSFEVIQEKHKRLREGLSVMGMSASAYWMSWLLTCCVNNLLITIATVLAGNVFGYAYFNDTPTLILFSMYFCFGFALQSLAIWVTTISGSATKAYVISYGVLLICVVLTLFINNMGVCYLIFMKTPPKWFGPILWLFRQVPAFNYAVMYVQIGTKSGHHYDFLKNNWFKGTGFTYEDLFVQQEGNIPNLIEYHMPAPWDTFMFLVKNILSYLLLAWYCDNVLAHNRGTASSPWFFLQKQYWCCFEKDIEDKSYSSSPTSPSTPSKYDSVSHHDYDYKNLTVENSVQSERERVLENYENEASCRGLRVVGINKIYQASMFRNSAKDVHAVRDVYLEVDDGELLSLLGHNGAGKTTLIGVLTGLSKPTTGTAIMYNYDITDEMDKIRGIMGVCPQFDILWNELTANEHLEIFAKLKGIPDHLIPEEINKRLRDVNLLKVKHARAGTFSGGMKRRLSMAIAFIGDPKVVFLDEPTTGMDPKNRRYIWELIQKMKKGRVVILTTHAMEEADILSDRIAVISQGSLRCVGTGLYLKNKYGDGYRLSIVVEKEDIETMTAELQQFIPSGRLIDCSGGSLLIGVPLIKVNELQTFFKIMENKVTTPEATKFKSKIKDWGLSNTTLEEVFMKITSTSGGHK